MAILNKIHYTQIIYLITGEQIFPKNLLSLQWDLDNFSVSQLQTWSCLFAKLIPDLL